MKALQNGQIFIRYSFLASYGEADSLNQENNVFFFFKNNVFFIVYYLTSFVFLKKGTITAT